MADLLIWLVAALGAVGGVVDRSAGTLEATDRVIAVDGHDEGVPEGRRFLEIADVSDVEDIENAIGEDEFFAPARQFLAQGRDFFEGRRRAVGHPRNYAVFSAFHNPVFHGL